MADIGPFVILDFDGYQPIVTFLFLSLDLLAFYHADQAALHDAAGIPGLIHKNQDVNGVAIVGFR
jgi:hypothetical protein